MTVLDLDQVKSDAQLIWQYCKHHKNSTIRWVDIFQYVLKHEKIRLSPARQSAAMHYLVEQGMLREITHGSAWRVQKPADVKPSKQHQETLDALRSSIRDEEEIKSVPKVEERITPIIKREIKLSEESTILAQALDFVKEFPDSTSTQLAGYFGITSNRATAMLNGLLSRKVVKRRQEERIVGTSKLGNPVKRKVYLYSSIEPAHNFIQPPAAASVQPQRRVEDKKTNVRVTISFTAASASIATMFYSYIKANGGAELSLEVHDE